MDFLKAILLSIVEGATEFLPVSSTGHLILAGDSLRFGQDTGTAFADAFTVIIQLPAILAVVVYFFKDMFPLEREKRPEMLALWGRVLVAFLPAAIAGKLLHDFIESKLFHSLPVAIALIVGGLLLIALEWRGMRGRIASVQEIGLRMSFLIGCFQCIALFPGTSRSAATIIGAMLLGANRAAAAEFSFFLAVPTMAAATGYKLLKEGFSFSAHQWLLLSVGCVGSFIVAYLSIAFMMAYIRKHSFALFGWYRIALGLTVIAVWACW